MVMPLDLPARVVEFCRLLRERELVVTPGRALDAARSLALVDVTDVVAFRAALRANLTVSVDEYPAFDAAFAEYWGELLAEVNEGDPFPNLRPTVEGPERPPEVMFLEVPSRLDGVSGEGQSRLPGGDHSASDADMLTRKDFRDYDAADVLRARRLIRQLSPALATVPSRRMQAATSGGRVDIRRTVRDARRHGGEVVRLARQRRRLKKLRIVALCDVSGSMDAYSRQLLQFLYALQAESGGVSTFVFSTRLHDVTHILRRKQYEEALAGLERAVESWSGGTTIGQCIGEFNVRYGARLLTPRTVVLIVCDGWERGDPERLAREMAVLKRRAYRVIWLNPLRGREGYEPLARGMAAALPYVDHFLAGNSIESLERLKRTLAGL
ncbi:MAG: VWA domain-containing protein [Dehalococcoidia bacterium]